MCPPPQHTHKVSIVGSTPFHTEAGFCRNNTENVLPICSFWRWRHFSPSEQISIVLRESSSLRNTNVKPAVLRENDSHHKYDLSCLDCHSDSVTDREWAGLSLNGVFHELEKFSSEHRLSGTAVHPYAGTVLEIWAFDLSSAREADPNLML